MSFTDDLERWCRHDIRPLLNNEEMQQFARQLAGSEELGRDEVAERIQQALENTPQPPSDSTSQAVEQYMQQQLADRMPHGKARGDRSPGEEHDGTDDPHSTEAHAGSGTPQQGALQEFAGAMLDQAESRLPQDLHQQLQQEISGIGSFDELERFTDELERQLAEPAPSGASGGTDDSEETWLASDGVPGGDHTDGEPGDLVQDASGTFVATDVFPRAIAPEDGRDQFDGLDNLPDQSDMPGHGVEGLRVAMQVVRDLGREHAAILKKIGRRLHPPTAPQDVSHLVEQLLQQRILSPTLQDTFRVNRDRVAMLMAKKAFSDLQRRITPRRHRRPGTHPSGTRGRLAVEPDKLQRTRHLSSRIAPFHTLQRGLFRRTRYPGSPLLDEDDLIEYGGRKKVGYSIVVAVDISGAVQFGRRIAQVRKACMAFGYYLRRYHPYDRVRYLAYHEVQRETAFADIGRLRAVNGAGKDIGGCLSHCRRMLRRDPDRIPVVILIGDGLPVQGDRAGIYLFRENNSQVIDGSYHQARMVAKDRIVFTFLQFAEERYLWKDLADETAGMITHEARGSLHRISSVDDVGRALLDAARRMRDDMPV